MAYILSPFFLTPPVTPNSLANLLRWYKADSFSLADGTAIGGTGNEWIDQTGSGNDLTESTALNRPVFHTNIYGTMPAVQFIAANPSWMTMPLVTLGASTQFTIAIVGATGSCIVLGHNSANMQVRTGHAGNNLFFYAGVGVDSNVCTTANTSVRMEIYRRDDAAGSMSFRDGKVNITLGGSDSNASTLNRLSDPNFGLHINGYIAEICIWTTNHTNADLDNLYDNYFKPRWGLP